MPSVRLFLQTALFGLVLAFSPSANVRANADHGPVLLTITGEITDANRNGYDESWDKFFGFSDVEFDKARVFDFSDIADLKTFSVKADFPKGRQHHVYEGPLLADVLATAGATGNLLTVRALDGYQIEASVDEFVQNGAILAFRRDGHIFGIGDFGPLQIVFPRLDREELSEMPDDNWVWSIFHIHVE